MASLSLDKNTYIDINVNDIANSSSDGKWIITSNITHDNNIGSYIGKTISSLIIGNTYKVTYTLSSGATCNTRIKFGDTLGIVRTTGGDYTEIFTLSGSKTIQFYATGNANIEYYKIEELVKIVDDTPVDISTMENKSWTLSFYPILNQFVSFHSYLPNNYLQHPRKLLAKANSSDLYLNNSGNYGKYFDEDIKPFIIETIFNEFPIQTKVFDSIHVNLDSTLDDVVTNTFFDKGIVYTENQCSGEIVFNLTNLTKKEKNWNFNKFLDITNNLSQKIFVSDWDNVSTSYPIDKVINVNKIDNSKPWYERGRMRDKYLAVRFIESNIDNNKLFCKFICTNFRASER